jgi:hypothetical protein
MAATTTNSAQDFCILQVTGVSGREFQRQTLINEGCDDSDYTNGEIYDLIRWKEGQTSQPDWYPKS